MSYYGYGFNEAAYYRPMQRNFRAAAARKQIAWLAADESRRNLISQLASLSGTNDFYTSLYSAFNEYGTLTEKQEAALVKSFAQRAERREAAKAKFAEANSGSQYVGVVGERRVFGLTVTFVKDLGGYFLNSLRDDDGNVFMYFGGKLSDVGVRLNVKGTIKRHQDYNGIRQTVISRPAVQ